ncbi:molybdenum cofactor guanylyltransferase MobA [Cupriavidus plantarum]|uniref:Molybdenum cofactor guanylyltransferase n=1 Tax=Cupriavidus plantarum TaxID=942865 RepID=A0A316FGF6_9BURK|nr:molybdenum cofactor guanylyltransferase MobA [Cupriavidus plantarum]PWK36750.1 molybdenum cofactor guanylyltransferase [Cupriavidus plantarum]
MIDPSDITGLILAGGRGSRMGGVDKGLQLLHGTPMALHTLRRLAPQTGAQMINANRHLDVYASFGVHVVSDDAIGNTVPFNGPLAGMLAGLAACKTPWMVASPCDTPFLPVDLVERLVQAIVVTRAEIAMPVTVSPDGRRQPQPAFCLMAVRLRDSLRDYLDRGERKIETWAASHSRVDVPFDDDSAFANINTLDELRAFEAR